MGRLQLKKCQHRKYSQGITPRLFVREMGSVSIASGSRLRKVRDRSWQKIDHKGDNAVTTQFFPSTCGETPPVGRTTGLGQVQC